MGCNLLISSFLLIVSCAGEGSQPCSRRSWPRVREGRRADRRPSECWHNAGFLLPSMRILRGMRPSHARKTCVTSAWPWTAPSQPDVASTSGRSHPLPHPAGCQSCWRGQQALGWPGVAGAWSRCGLARAKETPASSASSL